MHTDGLGVQNAIQQAVFPGGLFRINILAVGYGEPAAGINDTALVFPGLKIGITLDHPGNFKAGIQPVQSRQTGAAGGSGSFFVEAIDQLGVEFDYNLSGRKPGEFGHIIGPILNLDNLQIISETCRNE